MELWKPLRRLPSQGIGRFAVASLDEGIALRQAGLSASIVVLGALFEEQVFDLVAHQLTPVVSDGQHPSRLGQGRSFTSRPPTRFTSRSKQGWGGWDFLRKSCSRYSTILSCEVPSRSKA